MAGTIYGSKLQGMRAAVGDTLAELGRKNEKIVVIDAETAVATNIMPFKNEFPERFLTTCIAEHASIILILGIVLITAMSLNDWCVAPTLAAVIPA